MRRVWGSILLGLAVFLLVGAAMVRFYAADRLELTPVDQYVQTVAPGTGTYFDSDPATLTEKQADLVARRTVKGDVKASNQTTGVWDVSVVLETGDGTFVLASLDRVAFDRKSGESANCCGESVDSEPTRHTGLSYKFPFDTGKQTYQFWDVNSKKAYPARYVAEEKIQGLTTYKFVQDIPIQELRKQEVPGSLVGESSPSFQAPVVYSNTRTVWVEPKTGVIVKGSEQTKTTLQNSAGEDKVTVLDATLTFDPPTQRSQADLARDGITKINLVQWVVPGVALVLGLALGAVGLLLLRPGSRPEATGGDRGEELVPAGGPPDQAVPESDSTAPVGPSRRPEDRGAAEPRASDR
jgi:hypothetical protein